MSKPEHISLLLNQSSRQRMAGHNVRLFESYLGDPKTAIKFKEAKRDYDKSNECLELANNYLSCGLRKKAQKALDDAIFHGNRAISRFENFTEAYENIASAYLLKSDFNRVVEACKEINRIEPEMPDLHFRWARALFNLALQAVEHGKSDDAMRLLTEAVSEAEREVRVTGVNWQIVAVLTQVFALKVKILSPSVIRAGLDSIEAQVLCETLDCQIVCAKKLQEIEPSHDTDRMLKELRGIRMKLNNST